MKIHSNLLPGVPFIESPFFNKGIATAGFDNETRRVAEDLYRDGFAVIDFPDEEFDSIADQIKQDLVDKYDWEYWLSEGYDAGDSLRVIDAWKDNENVRRLATNATVISLLSNLFGRQAWPFQTLNFPVGTQQHYHSDSVHFSSVPERFMCGVWTALEDIDEDAGPLIYYPGSHKWPIYTNEHLGVCSVETPSSRNQQTFEPLWEALVEEHGIKPQFFTPKKGQSLIWLANLLHGGLKQSDKTKTRWSQVTHYYFEGCAYYTPLSSDPMYGAIKFRDPMNILTGERSPNKYCGYDIPGEFVELATRLQQIDRAAPLPADFDAAEYLAANPDVMAAGVDPIHHYRYFGAREGRAIKT
ncbi:phytanoyl-CoA dioxygenase family protein [Paraburkholderia sp. SEWSISQ10-3 4]|uniref:phytanoyl-CoA dioxygenase family protein n=1 Tax=Paraburkholderia TaxID=1822464 RepID=UPI00225B2BD6|nr:MULTISPECIES: phytanoyl-CoA dioxygenase family protein [Paraburkholderia]MCX4140334.1 phytanoyl-CoA dioxygenase family protein [Paraburkholderia aspalathi]MDN7173021.1 phytanoyl-CoA dioxygenase family protein [Paraburkholderia sp. SEWSISQ10-3 4]MDQ6502660.1 phytanoyl-CoA dioxygenase family protein [Paraburkholderia aspalathi]